MHLLINTSKACLSSLTRMINTSKALGWDAISPKILNLTVGAIAVPLTRLFNNCIRSGQWPSFWKMGVWTLVFKKDDRANKINYRPIKCSNLLSKQISDNMDSQMYSKMSAYRKMHSCETNLIRVTEDCVAVLSTDIRAKLLTLYIMLS